MTETALALCSNIDCTKLSKIRVSIGHNVSYDDTATQDYHIHILLCAACCANLDSEFVVAMKFECTREDGFLIEDKRWTELVTARREAWGSTSDNI